MRAEIGTLANKVHFLSAGAVGFARGLNDAPKIVAIALSAAALDIGISLFLVALAMALGGLAHSWRIADTLSHKIVDLTPAGGAMANLVTSMLVIGASNFGLPVSTTHVAVSSLFGLGVHGSIHGGGRANWTLVSGILTAWLLTLTTAGLCAAAIYWVAK
jgi:PiT family inorganic phosphate transporter